MTRTSAECLNAFGVLFCDVCIMLSLRKIRPVGSWLSGNYIGDNALMNMQSVAVIIISFLSAYFLVATFLARLRPRWGWMKLISLHPPGETEHYVKPRMGALSCLGFSLASAAFPLLYIGISINPIRNTAFALLVGCFLLIAFGQWRDKAKQRSWKRYHPRKNGKR